LSYGNLFFNFSKNIHGPQDEQDAGLASVCPRFGQ